MNIDRIYQSCNFVTKLLHILKNTAISMFIAQLFLALQGFSIKKTLKYFRKYDKTSVFLII